MIALALSGDAATIARFARAQESFFASVKSALTQQTAALQARVREKLDGEVLQPRTGRLRDAVTMTLESDDTVTTGSVSVDDVPYAAIQEFGGMIHVPEIVPARAKALAFVVKGKEIFAKRVRAHDVTIPERSYLRSTLVEMGGAIADALGDAVDAAAKDA